MSDMLVQDILDPEELEKRDAWNKRLDLPILVFLDDFFQKNEADDTLLSGEFIQKINPDNYRLADETVTPPTIRYMGVSCDQSLPKLLEDLHEQGKVEALTHFYPTVSILVDGSGHRNDNPETVLPVEQFVINRKKYDDPELFASHIKTLVELAFGTKGIGLRSEKQDFGFSKDHPFYIFVDSLSDSDLRQYMDEVLKVTEDLKKGLVKVVGFLAPKVG